MLQTIYERFRSYGWGNATVWIRTQIWNFPNGSIGYRTDVVRLDINRLIMQGSMTACPPVDWFKRVLIWYNNLGG